MQALAGVVDQHLDRTVREAFAHGEDAAVRPQIGGQDVAVDSVHAGEGAAHIV